MPQTTEAEAGKRRDTTNGKYTKTVSDTEILDFVGDHDLVGTTDVSGHFGHRESTAYRRLKRLEEDGKVRSRHIGNTLIWQINTEEDEV